MKINDEDKIQVSIITTVFNAKDFLNQSIESIRKQTFRNYEHLIINDGSTDGTKEYLDTINDSRIKVIHLERSGRGISLNRGLQESKGKYIAILDADDYSSKSRLELQTEILNENTDCDLIATSFGIHGVDEMIESPNQLINYKQHTRMLDAKDFIFSNPICHSSVMMRRELIFDAGLYDEKRKELFDFELWIRMLNGRKKVSILKLNLPLIFRNLHENQYFESKKRVNYLIQTYLLRRKLLSVLSHRFINELIIVCVLLYGLLPRFIRKRFMNKSKLGGT